jgi:hypothetical protein
LGDRGVSLALAGGGDIYLLGETSSTDFPTTPGAYDRNFGGITDCFVAALSGDLTTLHASTYLGGNDIEMSHFLVLDSARNVYLTGSTSSLDFPVTPDAFDKVNTENYRDGFISKLNGSLTVLQASTFLGGSSYDDIYSLALDDTGNVCVTGNASPDFPTTPGAYSQTYNNSDAFVSKLNGCSEVSLDLQAERREARSFSMVRQYGQVQFFAATCGLQVAEYRLLRRQSGDDFVLLRTVAPSELQDNQIQMQDKYLERDTAYSYRVEAYDAAGKLLGGDERTI